MDTVPAEDKTYRLRHTNVCNLLDPKHVLHLRILQILGGGGVGGDNELHATWMRSW